MFLIGQGEKKHYILMKDFNTFMYDPTLHCGRKQFCRYCLWAFRPAEKLKYRIKDCYTIILSKLLKCLRRLNILNSKILGKKIPLIIYAVFESVLAPEDNVKQNSNESYTNNYQK